MKKFTLFALSAFICLNISAAFAQSRRVPPTNPNQKSNQRPAASPTPTPENTEEITDENAVTDDRDIIKVDTELVTIPVKVSDRKGKFVPGLTKENFKVFEDDAEQEIAFFSNEQQPFTVALVLDMSYSSKFKINEIQSAAIAFIDQLRENDKVMVISFDEQVHILTEPTSDRARIYRAVKSTRVASGTSLYEAVDVVLNHKFKRISGRKAIVLFTDGVDTTSRRAHDLSNKRDAMEGDALIYPIQYDTFEDVQAMKNRPIVIPPTQPGSIPPGNPNPFPIPAGGVGIPSGDGTSAEDYRRAGEYLEEMANRTGGRLYQANNMASLAFAFQKIAAELREFYSLGYYPKNEDKNDGRRRIKVKVDQKGVSVQSRDSYEVRNKNKSKK